MIDGQLSIFDYIEEEKVKTEITPDIYIYNDDCLNVLKTIPNESIDLYVSDCPYHIVSGGCSNATEKGWSNTGEILRKDKKGNKFYSESNHVSLCGILNDYDPTTYVKNGKLFKFNEIKFSDWLPDIYRVLKPDTHCYIMINARNLKELWQECENVGFQFQQLIVWDKGNQTPNKYYLNSYELILMLRKGKAKNINNMGTKNILRVPNIIKVKKHPTEKPTELMEILIANSSNPGDTVMDSFMGVGSTGVACQKLGRKFIGIEIDEKYFNIAKERLKV